MRRARGQVAHTWLLARPRGLPLRWLHVPDFKSLFQLLVGGVGAVAPLALGIATLVPNFKEREGRAGPAPARAPLPRPVAHVHKGPIPLAARNAAEDADLAGVIAAGGPVGKLEQHLTE